VDPHGQHAPHAPASTDLNEFASAVGLPPAHAAPPAYAQPPQQAYAQPVHQDYAAQAPQAYAPPPHGYAPPPPQTYAPPAPTGPVWAPPPPVPTQLTQQQTPRDRKAAIIAASIFFVLIAARIAYAVHMGDETERINAENRAAQRTAASGAGVTFSAAQVAGQRNALFGVSATRKGTEQLAGNVGDDRPLKWIRVDGHGVWAGLATTDTRYDIVYSDRPDDGVTGPLELGLKAAKPVAYKDINPAAPARIMRQVGRLGYTWQPGDELRMTLAERPEHDGVLMWTLLVDGGQGTFYASQDGRKVGTTRTVLDQPRQKTA
jgi:hypothetical protein